MHGDGAVNQPAGKGVQGDGEIGVYVFGRQVPGLEAFQQAC